MLVRVIRWIALLRNVTDHPRITLTNTNKTHAITIDPILKSFRQARTEIVERLEGFEPEIFDRKAIHPRLKVSMRLVDLLFFTAEHDDYHLTRIREMRAS